MCACVRVCIHESVKNRCDFRCSSAWCCVPIAESFLASGPLTLRWVAPVRFSNASGDEEPDDLPACSRGNDLHLNAAAPFLLHKRNESKRPLMCRPYVVVQAFVRVVGAARSSKKSVHNS